MKATCNIDDGINILTNQRNLNLILQDWDSGIQVHEGIGSEEAKQYLENAREKYGPRFWFRAFNGDFDSYWNGDFGVIFTDKGEGKILKIPLEFDEKRHPGMLRFKVKNNDDLRKLRINASGPD